MCCFSRAVEEVSKTRIFARPAEGERQLLVYAMSVAIAEDVAMVLPIPVPARSPEDAVTFVDLSSCPKFFVELETLFPPPPASFGAPQALSRHAPPEQRLEVHDVGDFEASFVPTLKDFGRLDPRFQLPANVWDALPQYADWGFCVFKLRAPKSDAPQAGFFDRIFGRAAPPPVIATPAERHPMAFEFPRRDASRLFFPTVHIHDGSVHEKARFDHTLYCQIERDDRGLPSWIRSTGPTQASGFAAKRWLRDGYAYKRVLKGDLPNTDQYV